MIAYALLLCLGIKFELGWLWIASCVLGIVCKAFDFADKSGPGTCQ